VNVTCEACNLVYDDTYRFTYCPHDKFEMHCTVVNRYGHTKCCHTVEEIDDFLDRNGKSSRVILSFQSPTEYCNHSFYLKNLSLSYIL